MTIYDPTPEYVLMAKAGMTFPQILASLTTAPAERFADSARLGWVRSQSVAPSEASEGFEPGNSFSRGGASCRRLSVGSFKG